MHGLTAQQLLDVWERIQGRLPAVSAQFLLEVADPDAVPGALADLPIGQRDERLLRLREALFGAEIRSVADCPQCGGRLEIEIRTDELVPDVLPGPHPLCTESDGYAIEFRLPTGRDLIDAPPMTAEALPRWLLLRCVQKARRRGHTVAVEQVPEAAVEAVANAMELADPMADIRLALCCPACGHGWQAGFDILAFLREEIDAQARRLLREVHTLASVYGWRESDILALTPVRRQLYLEMIAG